MSSFLRLVSSGKDELNASQVRMNQTWNELHNRSVIEKIQDEFHELLCDWRIRKRKSVRCNCLKGRQLPNTCVFGENWFLQNYRMEEMDYLVRKYEELVNHENFDEKVYEQIMKDIPRTFPHKEYFKEDQESLPKLERILKAISLFDPQLGYVQGMNFLGGAFLFHCEEHVAFWNILALYERLEMRDIFLQNFPGLDKHIQILEILLYTHMPKLAAHMVNRPALLIELASQGFCGTEVDE